jgi:hypothetical protein
MTQGLNTLLLYLGSRSHSAGVQVLSHLRGIEAEAKGSVCFPVAETEHTERVKATTTVERTAKIFFIFGTSPIFLLMRTTILFPISI